MPYGGSSHFQSSGYGRSGSWSYGGSGSSREATHSNSARPVSDLNDSDEEGGSRHAVNGGGIKDGAVKRKSQLVNVTVNLRLILVVMSDLTRPSACILLVQGNETTLRSGIKV